ncbi:MAG: DeoR/GlpR transcriptional regulator [Lachnospiraceae bacterium]|nr:DeoR/GlpR transcriptional regulator [Lachnospiraceae bacterium]
MIQDERYQRIYDILKERQSVTVHFLKNYLYASEATIRRDLEAMESRGLLRRVWGGAAAVGTEKDTPDFVRIRTNIDKKEKIGRIAAKLIRDSSTLFIDSSTTCLSVIPYLSTKKNLTIVTSSLKMSKILGEQTTANIHILGGQIYEKNIVTGLAAIDSIRHYHTDLFFLSCSGVSLKAGFTSIEPKVVEVDREMMAHTTTVCMLCDTTKVGKHSLLRLASLDRPDYVIMDSVPDDPGLVAALGDRLITNVSQLS